MPSAGLAGPSPLIPPLFGNGCRHQATCGDDSKVISPSDGYPVPSTQHHKASPDEGLAFRLCSICICDKPFYVVFVMPVCTSAGTKKVFAPEARSNRKFSPSPKFLLLLMQMMPFQFKVCPDGEIMRLRFTSPNF